MHLRERDFAFSRFRGAVRGGDEVLGLLVVLLCVHAADPSRRGERPRHHEDERLSTSGKSSPVGNLLFRSGRGRFRCEMAESRRCRGPAERHRCADVPRGERWRVIACAAHADRSMGRSAATSARSTTSPGLLRETGRATMPAPGRYDAGPGCNPARPRSPGMAVDRSGSKARDYAAAGSTSG